MQQISTNWARFHQEFCHIGHVKIVLMTFLKLEYLFQLQYHHHLLGYAEGSKYCQDILSRCK